jgi:pimeloyl-ACP methyl ester carboxylesterase
MSSNIPQNTTFLTLRDGRRLAYVENDQPSGFPLFFFHGTPGSRNPKSTLLSIAERYGVRLISADRPGFGYSDFQLERVLLDWADDVVELADALEVERFAVMGVSGGGPYSTVCAYKIPHRLTSATLVSSPGPPDAPGDTHIPADYATLLERGRNYQKMLAEDPYQVIGATKTGYHSKADLEAQTQKSDQDYLIEQFQNTFLNGAEGYALDHYLMKIEWGFKLADIGAKVFLWHGETDTGIPVEMARYMAGQIPDCEATILPEMGHMMHAEQWDAIFKQATEHFESASS